MYHKNKVVGLVLGSGMLAKTLVDNCKKKKIKVHIIYLEDSFELGTHEPDTILEYDKIGNIFKYLKSNHISQIVFLGKVKKKSLYKIRPNLITLYYLFRLSLNYYRGDGKLINKILDIFYKKKINVLDPRIFLPNNLCNKKDKNNSKLTQCLSNKKISEFFLLAKEYSEKDYGQSVIVSNNQIILGEDERGTDFLIKRFKDLKFRGPAFLVKVTKPHQSLKVDLPTIGPTTVNNILMAGLKGLIVEDKKTLVENPSLTFKIIKKNRLFYYAY